jgi:heptosyltransferase-1
VVPLPIRDWKGKAGSPATWREARHAVRALRREGYDAAFDIQGNIKSGLVTWLSGAPARVGFDREGVRESPNLLFTNRKVRSLREDRHISRKYLRIVSDLFVVPFDAVDLAPSLAIPRDHLAAAGSLLKELLGTPPPGWRCILAAAGRRRRCPPRSGRGRSGPCGEAAPASGS